MSRKERIKRKKHKELSDAAKGSIPLTSWLRNKDEESCSSDKESIEEIQWKAVETSEKDEGDVRADEEESEEIQGDIKLSEEEEEMEREVQEEMSQEKDREITEEGATGADIEYQIQGTSEQDINQSLLALQFARDPAHVDQLKIQVNSDYIQFCCSLGPCQPVAGFPKNPQGILKCLKDKEIESVFPSLSELLKMYATLPVSTSTVERSFSKLKLMKSSL
ncbi:rho GTPase-activating protein gacV-like [Tachysurus vachellii]|uniref:rho GTPase-activating protein gacV-like n=1 Tax=Tachysurus vachellii TaxID=175792 RepID=UPI00296A9E94|nr:rho GTPase-activating protein gacV-like [Tachysurus vachellii]